MVGTIVGQKKSSPLITAEIIQRIPINSEIKITENAKRINQ
tara:strand:+ start:452 stop:574 length:123 start_codon:yes stop_codon:yes gene_type:complete